MPGNGISGRALFFEAFPAIEDDCHRRLAGVLEILYTDRIFDHEYLHDHARDRFRYGVYKIVVQQKNQNQWVFVFADRIAIAPPEPEEFVEHG